MPTYYAKAVVKGTTTAQLIHVEARSMIEAKRLMEGRLGEIARFTAGPVLRSTPPPWYR